MPQSEKLFGRYHDIAMLLTGFLLTTIVGGYLSHSWQTRSAEIQRVAEQKRNEIQAATAVFEDISRLMDKRLYRMRRISMGVGNDVDADIMSRRWDAYRESLFEWNENLNRYLALTQMYFGQEARDTLERDIQTDSSLLADCWKTHEQRRVAIILTQNDCMLLMT